jgi:Ca2+-binding EF-hand superfamily protein
LPQLAKLIDRLSKVEEEVSHLPAEESEVLALFTTIDEDDSGSLSMDELDGLPAISGAKLTNEEVAMMKSEADNDKDGAIIWEEFFDWMCDSGSPTAFKVLLAWRETVNAEEENAYELAQNLFTQLDKLDEGFIDNEQVQKLVEFCEAPLTREELDIAHKTMNKAGTGQVDMDEFAEFMLGDTQTAKLLKGTDNASKLLKYKEKRIAEGEEDTARAQSLTDFRVMTGNYRSQKGPIFESNVMQTVVRIKFV